jgi:predicted metalloprotease with PDZ domain
VAEGFTTYYGDLVLFNSGVIDWPMYLKELESTLKRHFDESDNACQSLLESSFDLWVDGYEKGTPGKKVSVYNKGAVAAMLLDYKIKLKTQGEKSLDDIMRILWKNFGDLKKGYTYDKIIDISEKVYQGQLKEFFDQVIAGSEPIFDYTNDMISNFNLKMERDKATSLVKLIQSF